MVSAVEFMKEGGVVVLVFLVATVFATFRYPRNGCIPVIIGFLLALLAARLIYVM